MNKVDLELHVIPHVCVVITVILIMHHCYLSSHFTNSSYILSPEPTSYNHSQEYANHHKPLLSCKCSWTNNESRLWENLIKESYLMILL